MELSRILEVPWTTLDIRNLPKGYVGDVRLFIVRLLEARVAQPPHAMHAVMPRTIIIPLSDADGSRHDLELRKTSTDL